MTPEMEENGLILKPFRDGLIVGKCTEDNPSVAMRHAYQGVNVIKVGRYAFSGMKNLAEVVVGRFVGEIDNYAFYDSRNLERVELWDRVRSMGDGAFRNCERLHRICLHVDMGRDSCIRDILSECPGEIRVELDYPDGRAELLFPEYGIEYFENAFTRTSMFRMETYGSGEAYRLCLQGSMIDYRAYDALFERAQREDRAQAAAAIAMLRLRSPRELLPVYQEAYITWLRQHAADAVRWILEEEEPELLTFLQRQRIFTEENIFECLEAAKEAGDPAVTAKLLVIRMGINRPEEDVPLVTKIRDRYEL